MTDYKKEYEHISQNSARLIKMCPDVGKAFRGMHRGAFEPKALDVKQKELIALGIAIGIRCEGCIVSHMRAAIDAGATMDEIVETVDVAILMGGGPSTIYGGKALECAVQFFEE